MTGSIRKAKPVRVVALICASFASGSLVVFSTLALEGTASAASTPVPITTPGSCVPATQPPADELGISCVQVLETGDGDTCTDADVVILEFYNSVQGVTYSVFNTANKDVDFYQDGSDTTPGDGSQETQTGFTVLSGVDQGGVVTIKVGTYQKGAPFTNTISYIRPVCKTVVTSTTPPATQPTTPPATQPTTPPATQTTPPATQPTTPPASTSTTPPATQPTTPPATQTTPPATQPTTPPASTSTTPPATQPTTPPATQTTPPATQPTTPPASTSTTPPATQPTTPPATQTTPPATQPTTPPASTTIIEILGDQQSQDPTSTNTPAQAHVVVQPLPFTGSSHVLLELGIGITAVAVGATFVVVSRRKV